MTTPKKKGKAADKPLTEKQAKTVDGIQKRIMAGEPLSRDLMVEETAKNYDVKATEGHSERSIASTILSENLKKPYFLAQLGFTDSDSQIEFKNWLWQGLMGLNPMWPKDKALAMKCADLIGKGAIAAREHVVHTDAGDLETRSTVELKFFEQYDRWPSDQAELNYYATHGRIQKEATH